MVPGKKYLIDGYVDDGYSEVIVIEPLRSYIMFGKTTRVFPFRPNWSTPPSESLEWRTDILKARNATEQRRALRQKPRRGFDYSLLLSGELPTYFESLLFGWQNRYFALPVWTDKVKLSASVVELGTSLPVASTDTYGFQEGGFALLFYSERIYDVVQITTVGPASLTLAQPLERDWPAGSAVYPLVVGHLSTSVPTSRETSSTMQASVNFIGSPDTAYPHIPDAAAPVVYDGAEVIVESPNWKAAISNEFTHEFDTVDAGVGPLAYFETETIARVTRPFQWYLTNRQKITEFRKLMGRLRGQQKSVWMPSWHDDFVIAASNVANQATLIVKGTVFHSLVGTDTSRDRVEVKLANGTKLYRRIIGTVPNYSNDTTTLTLDSTLGNTVTPSDGSRVRLLLRCRLATDKIVIPWLTDSVAEPQTTFITVKL